MAYVRRAAVIATRQLVAAADERYGAGSSALADLIVPNSPTPTSGGSGGYTLDGTYTSRGHRNTDVTFYIYIFLGVMISVGVGSVLVYCCHQRRVRRFVEHDNMNNNMQRHSLIDSFIEAGEVEWQCTVCYHENHPAKRECLMCGTPQVISHQAVASPARGARPPTSFAVSAEERTLLAARNRSFHVRRLNEMNLNQRQRGARRRNLWQREKTEDGQFRWVRIDDCRPSRLSLLGLDRVSLAPTSPPPDGVLDMGAGAYIFSGGSRRDFSGAEHGANVGVETELRMSTSADVDGHFAPVIRIHTTDSASALLSPAAAGFVGSDFIAQPSVGYVRHVDGDGNVEWVPAEMHFHEAETIDVDEFPRASSVIDFESVAALSFRHKVRWFLHEIEKVSVPWEEGHLLLKIRRDAVLSESMHLLMLVPASDLRQRLRIEFIEEPGLDAGGLMREWVLLLCERLFDESFGLFQPTHVENLGYWINPNSSQIHRDHLHCYQFVGRLIAKCLLEGQLLTVHFSLPLLKHLLGVPISFSDLEFLDEELYRNALWLRENANADALSLDFMVQRIDGNDEM
ncbi:hypothetical protein PybrP1_000154 [[Pythium] brassicae (nom. inval.)]|nr:hypothetical protein PybrP1_000154 [[Pythium] brassicae (nom. inval.)]